MRVALSLLLTAACTIPASHCLAAEQPTRAELQFFETKIRPVLVNQCYECHSSKSKEPKGGLLLDTREGIRRGGESGHGVVPGNLDESLVLSALRYESFEMPPDKQLPETVVADFARWIEMGAPDPREGESLVQNKIDFEKARSYWAYQPIAKPGVPQVHNAAWPRTDVDAFLLARLEAEKLPPVVDADPVTFARRVYFDLLGLPPSPEEVDQFVAECNAAGVSPANSLPAAAVERLVDRLLESPQFGERWGRHWLDVARFGESTGMERNFTYPHAWRYRDWVIEAFNADKPYSQFIIEQIAGDLLPAESAADRLRNIVATGFLALGPKSLNERNAEQFAMDIVDDQIDVASRAFLGLTVACARCHDHKFDAIPQQEYYALAGIFRSTDTFYGTGGGAGNRQAGSLLAVDGTRVTVVRTGGGQANQANAATQGNVKQLNAQVRKLEANVERLKANPAPAAKNRLAKAQQQLEQARKRLVAARRKTTDVPDDTAPKPDSSSAILVMGVRDAAQPGDTQLRLRGEPDDRGDTVDRGFLTVASLGDKHALPADASGRLQLAQWIVDPRNPLTARVAVNRIWQHLFGRGLVASVDNFGTNGDRPTHPELLDYLAARFMEDGWSVKRQVKLLVQSRAYQLDCASHPAGLSADPDNHLLWRQNQRRLEAESIRDAMLAASGQLDLQPPVGSVVSQVGDGDVGRGISPDRFETLSAKRSVYLPIVRSAVPESLQVFDFPEASILTGQREVTTVPLQALYMLNSPFVLAQAKALATRIGAEADSTQQRIERAFRLALCRPPTADEVSRIEGYLAEIGQQPAPSEDDWAKVCHVLLASAEFRYLQ
ncbi:MAG: DUF1553 domain-containing protein [Pirellulaceae bacterium]|nr:DUF1553 domain-containing protein [Pirellulaceae bacterium]